MPHFLETIISIGFLAGMMWGMMKFMLKDIHNDLQDIRKDIGGVKQDIADLKTAQNNTNTRIDHLYQICIEMLGSRHKH